MLNRDRASNLLQRFSEICKDFLLSEKSREFFLFMFFFFVAGGFWLLQTLNGDFEHEFSVPLRLRGVPDEVVLTSDLPPVIYVKLKDRGTVLLNYQLGKGFLPLTIEFDKVRAKGNRVTLTASEFEKQLSQQLGASSSILAVRPDTVEFYYAEARSKKVPVCFSGHLTAAKTYFLSDTIFRPDSVEVFAPVALLDTISAAYITPVECKDISDTLRRVVAIEPIKGAKFQPRAVGMDLCTDLFTDASLEIPLEGIDFPEHTVLRTFPSRVKVLFQVGRNRYKTLSENEFHLLVSYEELMQLPKGTKYEVKLLEMPKGIRNVRFDPPQVDFLIEQVNDHEEYFGQ